MKYLIRLHFGCGGHQLPGWVNTDLPEVDITKPLPYESASASDCLASHVVEHISGPDALRFFMECHRVLIPNGKLRLIIPIVGPWLRKEHAIDLTLGHGHLCIYNEDTVRTMLWMAGFDQQHIRRTDFNPETDRHQLTIGVELDAIESLRIEATK